MSAPVFAIDTHALYWHLTNAPNLSLNARKVFEDAQRGLATLAVPHVVLAEFFYLLQSRAKYTFFKRLLTQPNIRRCTIWSPSHSLTFGSCPIFKKYPKCTIA